jgi:hypothetical protein
MAPNPFAKGLAAVSNTIGHRENQYYRIFRVDNLHGVAS